MSGKPKFVPEDKLLLTLQLREQGRTLQEISDQTGISRERTRHIISRNGGASHVPISLSLATYDHLDPMWLIEFRGFFYGEGCASVNAQSSGRRLQYQPRLAVSLREDDVEVVLDLQEHLGGNVVRWHRETRPDYPNTRPSANWQLVGFSKLANLLPLLLAGVLPAKKRKDLEILNEMCQVRLTMPFNLTDEHSKEMSRYYEALRSIKRYQEE